MLFNFMSVSGLVLDCVMFTKDRNQFDFSHLIWFFLIAASVFEKTERRIILLPNYEKWTSLYF